MSSAHLDPSESEAVLDTSSERPKSYPFLDIPRELRDMIYSHLVTARDVTILRLSHQVCDEAQGILYKEGIFPLFLQHSTAAQSLMVSKSTEMPSKKVRNFSITIEFHKNIDVGNLEPYVRNCIQGSGDCQVTLVFSAFDSDVHVSSRLKSFIESLNSFKRVTLRICLVRPDYHPMDRRNGQLVKPGHTLGLELMATSFSTALGVPAWKSEPFPSPLRTISDYVKAQQSMNPFPEAQYLEFYPRKQRQLAGGAD